MEKQSQQKVFATRYKNGIKFKMNNSRVVVVKEEEDSYGVFLRTYLKGAGHESRAVHKTIHKDVAQTFFRLSHIAAKSLSYALLEMCEGKSDSHN